MSWDRVVRYLGPAPLLARLFNFHLMLKPRGKSDENQATPAFLFLPFYLDQDKSWGANWCGFMRLSQFQKWKTDVAEFHAGIKPNEYYIEKAALGQATEEFRGLSEKRNVMEGVLFDLATKLREARFDTDIDSYSREVQDLLVHATSFSWPKLI